MKMINQVTISKIVLAALFVICLADMPYGYFQLVRFLGMIGFAFLAFKEYKIKKNGWVIFYLASAILINPICKVSLGRVIWNVVDIIWALILIITIFINKKNDLN